MTADDGEINFGYCEVEERCRQSFEAWQDKQKELEDQEKKNSQSSEGQRRKKVSRRRRKETLLDETV